jgi:hypothetical protein
MVVYFYFPVAKLASDVIKPLVRKMDEESRCDPAVMKALFENGVSVVTGLGRVIIVQEIRMDECHWVSPWHFAKNCEENLHNFT